MTVPRPPVGGAPMPRPGTRLVGEPVRTPWDDVVPGAADGFIPRLRLTAVAATVLFGHRIVTARPDGTVELADPTRPEHLHAPLWMTLGSAVAGGRVDLLMHGVAPPEPSWSWAPGPVFLGAAGGAVQTVPTAETALFLAQVGVATGATALYLDRQPSILLT